MGSLGLQLARSGSNGGEVQLGGLLQGVWYSDNAVHTLPRLPTVSH